MPSITDLMERQRYPWHIDEDVIALWEHGRHRANRPPLRRMRPVSVPKNLGIQAGPEIDLTA
jgi:hypothetical protein